MTCRMKMDRIVAAAPLRSMAAPIRWWHIAALLLVVTVVLRAGLYGDALVGDDEQFYLLVGDRMWRGAMPYVNIFDRKPIGLFMLFALMRLLGGEGVLASQLVATVFVAGTALAITAIAARRVAIVPAVLAGIFYIAMLEPIGGGSTQAPVFYNLLTAVAGWLALGTAPAIDRPGDLKRAVTAMLLCGVAIQIKTNVALEGMAIGGWLVVRLACCLPWRMVVARAALFAMLGLAPTLLAGAAYGLMGHFDAWWFANALSQFHKTGGFDAESLGRLGAMLRQGSPVLFACIGGLGLMRFTARADERWWLLAAWSAMALVEAFSIGNFWTFYLLPVTVIASICGATLFAQPRWGRWAFGALAAPAMLMTVATSWMDTARAARATTLTLAAIPADVATSCMLAYDAPVAFLQLSHACLVTPYIFVDELRSQAEAHALPIDATIALHRALARRPGTILTVDRSHWTNRNFTNDAILRAALARGYHRIATVERHLWASDPEAIAVWRRNNLALPRSGTIKPQGPATGAGRRDMAGRVDG